VLGANAEPDFVSVPRPTGSPLSHAQPAPPEPTPGERLARLVTLAKRGRRFLLGALVVMAVGLALSAYLASLTKRNFASECTIAIRNIPRPDGGEGESTAHRTARVKDMLVDRSRLEAAIKKFRLYPQIVETRDVLEAVDAMRPHVGVRARESGRYVVSFDINEEEGVDTRTVVRDVTQYLAETLADDFVSGGVKELRNQAAFLEKEVATANKNIDDAVGKVTLFLGVHPEFSVEIPPGGAAGVTGTGAKKAGTPGITTSPTKPEDPAMTALRNSDPVLAALWRQRARLEADLKASASPETPPPAPTPGVSREAAATRVEDAKKRYAEASADLQAKQLKLTEEHPDMKASRATAAAAAQELRDARAQLAAIDAKNTGTEPGPKSESDEQVKLKEVIAQIVARENVLLSSLAKHEPAPPPLAGDAGEAGDAAADVTGRGSLETDWQRLLRTLADAKSQRDVVKQRFESAQLAANGAEVGKGDIVSIVEPAYRPLRPSKAKRLAIALTGGFSSLAAALCWILARIALDGRIFDQGDVEALGVAPVLGVIPTVAQSPAPAQSEALVPASASAMTNFVEETSAPFDQWPIKVVRMVAAPKRAEVLAFLRDDVAASASLRVIRHKLELLHAEGIVTFAITSPNDRDGKSTVAALLAMALSESQRARVLLVEGNLHHPSLAELFGLDVPPPFGISAQLVRKIEGEDWRWHVVAIGPSLHVLAESPRGEAIPRVVHSGQFQDALASFRELYDYVVVDGPKILGSGDANALETAVEGMLIVVGNGVSSKGDVRRALRQLGTRHVVGFVLAERGPSAPTT
jgi:Mrp family chromosome partitioning ATPase